LIIMEGDIKALSIIINLRLEHFTKDLPMDEIS
jgi:hypothetical protein